MTPVEISQYLGLILAALALLGHAKGYFSSGEKTLIARVDQAEKTVADHGRRIQSVEGEMQHLPDREAQHRMELQLTEMNGRFATFEERLRPISATSERLHELLMEKAR